MKKIILGIIIGAIALAAFLYFGGAKYVKTFGKKTERAGVELEKYEKGMKKAAKEAKDAAVETMKKMDKAVDKTVDKTKETVGDTKDRVKELVR